MSSLPCRAAGAGTAVLAAPVVADVVTPALAPPVVAATLALLLVAAVVTAAPAVGCCVGAIGLVGVVAAPPQAASNPSADRVAAERAVARRNWRPVRRASAELALP